MSPVIPNPQDRPHIEFVREPEHQPERRRRSMLPPPIPRPDRRTHGRELNREFATAETEIAQFRERNGIDPAHLIVLEFESINFELRDAFEERFGAWVVEERRTREETASRYHYLVQFPNLSAIQRFRRDLQGYTVESEQRTTLPPWLRRNFFDSLQNVRAPSREDRIGQRLEVEGFPESENFFLDIDLWHPGENSSVQQLRAELRRVCDRMGGAVVEELRTESMLLAKVRATRELAELLLEWDVVARVELPARISEPYRRLFSDQAIPSDAVLPADDDPLVCVLDSGVVSGHPLLRNWVIEERDFDTGENTPTDLNGHGTSVAGIVVYGDVGLCLQNNVWRPRVRICSAKILKDDSGLSAPGTGRVAFPESHRIERVVEDAVRYFATERGCRIFNFSVGNEEEVYRGGRQFPLAEKLDQLARELDIVIVVSAGNASEPEIPEHATTREAFQRAVLDQLRTGQQRVCNPATASLALTVGAISRKTSLGNRAAGDVGLQDAVPGAPEGSPAPFTRTGPGYELDSNKAAVKPEFVHYGGNAALLSIAGSRVRWTMNHFLLGEPTIRREDNGRFVGAVAGTSFAAPHLSHIAGIAAAGIERGLGRPPSANLIRAAIGSAAHTPPCGSDWLGPEEDRLRLVGYGVPDLESVVWSHRARVRLISEDMIPEDALHIYRLPIPESFLREQGRRGIVVSLAFDPPVRASRKEYLARTMWTEVLQGLSTAEVEDIRGKYTGEDAPTLPSGASLGLRAPKTKLQWSTLQVRSIEWKRQPKLRVARDERQPVLHVVVGCQRRFATGLDESQRYALVVYLWHEGERIELYNALRAQVRLPATRVRVRV